MTAEKRIDVIRVSCQSTQKKISSCSNDFGSETSSEKRLVCNVLTYYFVFKITQEYGEKMKYNKLVLNHLLFI